jgi:outer membrane protein assembly factor BamB
MDAIKAGGNNSSIYQPVQTSAAAGGQQEDGISTQNIADTLTSNSNENSTALDLDKVARRLFDKRSDAEIDYASFPEISPLWSTGIPGSGRDLRMTVSSKGDVFTASGGVLGKLNPDNGNIEKLYKTNRQIDGLVVSDKLAATLEVGNSGQVICGVDPAGGKTLWETRLINQENIIPCIVLTPDNNVVTFCFDRGQGNIISINGETGEKNWEYKTGDKSGNVTLGKDGNIIASAGDKVISLEAATGKLLWESEDIKPRRSPICNDGGNIVTLLWDSKPGNYGIDLRNGKTGEQIASYSVENRHSYEFPEFGKNAFVYTQQDDGYAACDLNTGKQVWKTEGHLTDAPVVSPDGVLYAGLRREGQPETVWALDPATGDRLFRVRGSGAMNKAICTPGGLFIRTDETNKTLSAFKPGELDINIRKIEIKDEKIEQLSKESDVEDGSKPEIKVMSDKVMIGDVWLPVRKLED